MTKIILFGAESKNVTFIAQVLKIAINYRAKDITLPRDEEFVFAVSLAGNGGRVALQSRIELIMQ